MGWKVEFTCSQGCKHWIASAEGKVVELTDYEERAKDFAFRSVAYDYAEKINRQSNGTIKFRIVPILFIVRTVQ